MRSLAEIVSLRTDECLGAAGVLPAIAAGESVPEGRAPEATHAAQCLRCQAEVSVYRRFIAGLRDLRHDVLVPPVGAVEAVIEALSAESAASAGSAPGLSWAVRAAYVGGITVATAAAGAAGVLVWISRRRLGLAPAS